MSTGKAHQSDKTEQFLPQITPDFLQPKHMQVELLFSDRRAQCAVRAESCMEGPFPSR